jgi:hypothetical protein
MIKMYLNRAMIIILISFIIATISNPMAIINKENFIIFTVCLSLANALLLAYNEFDR